jgi:hypothetical protein
LTIQIRFLPLFIFLIKQESSKKKISVMNDQKIKSNERNKRNGPQIEGVFVDEKTHEHERKERTLTK